MSLRSVRWLQVIGIIIAAVGLTGFWLTRDVQRTILDEATREILGIEEGEFQASFIVAGRDYDYVQAASPCRWIAGECVRERPGQAVYGGRTDTILYVNVIGETVNIVAIPRDLYLDEWRTAISGMYAFQGAQGLKRAVSEVLGLPIDYYAVINIDLFQNMVDAIGGVEVNVPDRMYYRDAAADLTIDLQQGPQRLDGEQAAGFVRYRETIRGDYDRIDRVKVLAYAMLSRLRELNVRAVGTIPSLVETFFEDVETNASPALVTSLLPRLGRLELMAATLPTNTPDGSSRETYSPAQVESFVADMMGGRARDIAEAPEAPVLITNGSGIAGLEGIVKDRLVRMGLPEEQLLTREGSVDPAPSRVLATADRWQDAGYYASLFHVGQLQIDRLPRVDGRAVGIELVLGENAAAWAPGQELMALTGGGD